MNCNINSVGVILITYNGEKYIYQQLASIKKQSISPDYVLIIDDCSTDNTCKVIDCFLNEQNVPTWNFIKRDKNVGWRINAYEALISCKTDVVFWSDQDDVWFENKIEEMFKVMKNSDCLAVYSSWEYIDSSGKTLELRTGANSGKILAVNPFLLKKHIPPLLGCSACFRRELICKLSLIIPCVYDSPDVILCLLVITLGKILYVDRPLFKRRMHGNNVTLTNLKRSWKFSYTCKQEGNLLLAYQYDMFDKFITEVKKLTEQSDISFASAEKNYIWYRLNFLKHHNHIMKYLFFSMKQNCLSDFCYVLYSDVIFIVVDIIKKRLQPHC